jgi:hypothetical protein
MELGQAILCKLFTIDSNDTPALQAIEKVMARAWR